LGEVKSAPGGGAARAAASQAAPRPCDSAAAPSSWLRRVALLNKGPGRATSGASSSAARSAAMAGKQVQP
jgi:hypothetical protein